jgi:Ring finger domain
MTQSSINYTNWDTTTIESYHNDDDYNKTSNISSVLITVSNEVTVNDTNPRYHNNNNTNNQMARMTPSYVDTTPVNWVLVGSMIGMLFFLISIFLYLIIPPLLLWMKRLWPVPPHRIERRYETIEGWLISKRIVSQACHTEGGGCCSCPGAVRPRTCNDEDDTITNFRDNKKEQFITVVKDSSSSTKHHLHKTKISVVSPPTTPTTTLQTILSMDTAETVPTSWDELDEVINPSQHSRYSTNHSSTSYDDIECCTIPDKSECSICMESFTNDTIISWSPNDQCDHVFHHCCIKEWLLHHDTCPCCRTQFLLVDADPYDPATKLVGSSSTPSSFHDEAPRSEFAREERTRPSMNRFHRHRTTSSNFPNNNNTSVSNTRKSSSPKLWTTDQLKLLAMQRSIRYNSTFFCMEHGLVTIEPKDRRLDKMTRRKLIASNISSTEELIQLRRRTSMEDTKQPPSSNNVVLVDGEVPTNEALTVPLHHTNISTCFDHPFYTAVNQSNTSLRDEDRESLSSELDEGTTSYASRTSHDDSNTIMATDHNIMLFSDGTGCTQTLEYNSSIMDEVSSIPVPTWRMATETETEIVWIHTTPSSTHSIDNPMSRSHP